MQYKRETLRGRVSASLELTLVLVLTLIPVVEVLVLVLVAFGTCPLTVIGCQRAGYVVKER